MAIRQSAEEAAAPRRGAPRGDGSQCDRNGGDEHQQTETIGVAPEEAAEHRCALDGYTPCHVGPTRTTVRAPTPRRGPAWRGVGRPPERRGGPRAQEGRQWTPTPPTWQPMPVTPTGRREARP